MVKARRFNMAAFWSISCSRLLKIFKVVVWAMDTLATKKDKLLANILSVCLCWMILAQKTILVVAEHTLSS